MWFLSHHSLVTPIDWKLFPSDLVETRLIKGHHSLVTPIDWKPLGAHVSK